jgi:hypothetical protein
VLSSRDLVSRDQVAVAGNVAVCRALRDAAIHAPIAHAGSHRHVTAIHAAMLDSRDLGASGQVAAAGNAAVCRALRDAASFSPIAVAGSSVAGSRKGSARDSRIAEDLAWGVLGTSRIACTLATARIVSKTEAGRWALATYPSEWHRAIQDALAVRRGEIHSLPATRFGLALDFVRFVIAQSQRVA